MSPLFLRLACAFLLGALTVWPRAARSEGGIRTSERESVTGKVAPLGPGRGGARPPAAGFLDERFAPVRLGNGLLPLAAIGWPPLDSTTMARSLWLGKTPPAWPHLSAALDLKLPTRLLWPVEGGRFVRGYGSGPGGYHRAIDISAPAGTPVRAIAEGVATYVGNALRGYGNLVLVSHADGSTALYAHHRRVLVEAGEVVRQGQVIAEVGNTGRSRGPHVHLEWIAPGGRVCDPLPAFDRADAKERRSPSDLRCGARRPYPHL